MKGLLGLLAGAADTLDFIPGFDPVKDKQGLISHLLGGGSNQPVNPSGVPPIVPQNSVQKRPFQGAAPGGAIPSMPMKPPNPADFTTSYNILDVFNPFKDTNKIDRDDAHRFNTAQQKYESQQAQMASQQQSRQLADLLTRGGMSQEQIARIQAANMMNPDKAGESFATNLEAATLNEGDQRHTMFGGPVKNVRTPTPIDPQDLAIRQQNADAATMTAEAAKTRAEQPTSPLVQNVLPSNKGETSFQTERGKAASSAMDAINERGDAAATTIADADMMNSLIDQIDYTGFGSETLLNVQKVGRMVGLDIGDDVPAKEAATRLTAKLGLALKSDLPGPMSDGDRQFLLSIPPNIATTRAGNKALVYMMRKRAQFAKDMQDSLNQAAPQTMQEYYDWERQFRAGYPPLFDAASQRDMMIALGMAGS